MADNYLEKKMEEHLSRQSATPRRSHATKSTFSFFPCRNILVVAQGEEWETEAVTMLRAAGHRVALLNPTGMALAQATGSRCYPFSRERLSDAVTDIRSRWGSLDIIVKASPDNTISIVNLLDGITATVDAAQPSAVLLLTHPSARSIRDLQPLT